MKKIFALAALCLALIPHASAAAAKKTAETAPAKYECTKCHMIYSAADAKKNHMKDPMDGGKLVPVAPAKKAAPMAGMKM